MAKAPKGTLENSGICLWRTVPSAPGTERRVDFVYDSTIAQRSGRNLYSDNPAKNAMLIRLIPQ